MIVVALHDLEAVFGWILSASWQASFLALLVLLLQKTLGARLNPRWRYALWLLVLVRLVLPALPESALSVFQFAPPPPPSIVEPVTEPLFVSTPLPVTYAEAPATAPAYPFSFYTLLALIWLTGAVALLALTWQVNRRFSRQIANSPEITDSELLSQFAAAKNELSIRRAIRLVENSHVQSPAIMGLFQPTLLLPANAREKFDDRELRFIFLHELAHLRRGDVVAQALIALLQIVHWFNPFLWFAFRRMRIDREPATDALVLSRTGEDEKERYGLMLIKLLEHFNQRHSLPTLVGILEDKYQFRRRFSLIAKFTRGAYGWSLLGILLITILAMACLTKAKSEEKSALSTKPSAISSAQSDADVAAKAFVEIYFINTAPPWPTAGDGPVGNDTADELLKNPANTVTRMVMTPLVSGTNTVPLKTASGSDYTVIVECKDPLAMKDRFLTMKWTEGNVSSRSGKWSFEAGNECYLLKGPAKLDSCVLVRFTESPDANAPKAITTSPDFKAQQQEAPTANASLDDSIQTAAPTQNEPASATTPPQQIWPPAGFEKSIGFYALENTGEINPPVDASVNASIDNLKLTSLDLPTLPLNRYLDGLAKALKTQNPDSPQISFILMSPETPHQVSFHFQRPSTLREILNQLNALYPLRYQIRGPTDIVVWQVGSFETLFSQRAQEIMLDINIDHVSLAAALKIVQDDAAKKGFVFNISNLNDLKRSPDDAFRTVTLKQHEVTLASALWAILSTSKTRLFYQQEKDHPPGRYYINPALPDVPIEYSSMRNNSSTPSDKPISPDAQINSTVTAPSSADVAARPMDLLMAKEDADARQVLVTKMEKLPDGEFASAMQALGYPTATVSSLQDAIVSTNADLANLQKDGFADNHPRIQALHAQLDHQQQQLKAAIAGMRQALTVDSLTSNSRVGLLLKEANDAAAKTGGASPLHPDALARLQKDRLAAQEDSKVRRVLLDNVKDLPDDQFLSTLQGLGRGDAHLTALQADIDKQTADIATLLKEGYAQDHPRIQILQAELTTKQQRMKYLITGLRRAMSIDSQMADSRATLLAKEVDNQKATLAPATTQPVKTPPAVDTISLPKPGTTASLTGTHVKISISIIGKNLKDWANYKSGTTWTVSAPNIDEIDMTTTTGVTERAHVESVHVFPYVTNFEPPQQVNQSSSPATLVIPMTPSEFHRELVGWGVDFSSNIDRGLIQLQGTATYTVPIMQERMGIYGENTGPIYADIKNQKTGILEHVLITSNTGAIPSFQKSVTPFFIFAQPGKPYKIKLQAGTESVDATITCDLM